jgi:hypothetical protein
MDMTMRALKLVTAVIVGVVVTAAPAAAQVDPLLFMKLQGTNAVNVGAPNVLIVVDTGNRMQRDAPTDTTNASTSRTTSTYYDPWYYPLDVTKTWQTATLNVTAANTTQFFRRKYAGLDYASGGSDKYTANGIAGTPPSIVVVRDRDAGYTNFAAATRMAIARAAIYQAVSDNASVARFGLIQMRQQQPSMPNAAGNAGPMAVSDPTQQVPTDSGSLNGRWNITRFTVNSSNGNVAQSGVLIKSDSATANQDVLNKLGVWFDTGGTVKWKGPGAAPASLPTPLIPAGNDDANTQDTPVNNMLVDAKAEATRLIGLANDPACRNTIVVLIVGGGEGNTSGANTNATLATTASGFTAISGRRVPIYVIALAPPSSDRAALKAIATNSGGQYFEVTKSNIDNALADAATTYPSSIGGAMVVPAVSRAIDVAVAHAFAASTDFNTFNSASFPSATYPFGPSTEFQVTSPIIGMVDLTNAVDINGSALPLTTVYDKAGNVIPQRSNLMVTTGLTVPASMGALSMNGTLRAFRTYKPVADSTQLSGYKFAADGTRLWIACAPGTGSGNTCTTPTGISLSDSSVRNLYTSLADGTMIAFNASNAATLAPLMNLPTSDAKEVINYVRNLPIGPIVDSTAAIMNPPSLDPPPDDSYPGFAVNNKGRRSIIWVGTNNGVLEGIDARTGIEVWGFIPLNLLPKLRSLRDGVPVGKFDFFVDGSAKISDVRLTGICDSAHPEQCWRTHLIIGEGPGGTFYQSFDVTMSDMASVVNSSSDDVNQILSYFSDSSKITMNWAFPKYADFDPTIAPYGDISANAPTVEKTVGQTWSDPAVGEVASTSGPYSVLLGSGFFPYSTQQNANRGGTVAGTTFYIVSAKDGTVYSSKDVGTDGVNETVDDCRTNATGCKQIKNALQSDAVATGPADSRFISKTYMGDLDGNLWRFDIGLDASNNPKINAATKLYSAGSDQPIFNSMATLNVGGTQQFVFFGTGSDLLPGTDKNTVYHLLGVQDNGASGAKTFDQVLQKSNSASVTADEKVTAFPAVAGDIVFFTTTVFNPSSPCTAPTANLYAFTYVGGAAYDSTGDNAVTNQDKPLVKSIAGQRATAPFIVDQHLAFSVGGKVELFGDPNAYNNGVGQAGVRILSWREIR